MNSVGIEATARVTRSQNVKLRLRPTATATADSNDSIGSIGSNRRETRSSTKNKCSAMAMLLDNPRPRHRRRNRRGCHSGQASTSLNDTSTTSTTSDARQLRKRKRKMHHPSASAEPASTAETSQTSTTKHRRSTRKRLQAPSYTYTDPCNPRSVPITTTNEVYRTAHADHAHTDHGNDKKKNDNKPFFVTPSPHRQSNNNNNNNNNTNNANANATTSIQGELKHEEEDTSQFSSPSSSSSLSASLDTTHRFHGIPSIICPYMLLQCQTIQQQQQQQHQQLTLSPRRLYSSPTTTCNNNNNIVNNNMIQCSCAFQLHHNHSKILTESFLCTYGDDYHSSLISTETPALPISTRTPSSNDSSNSHVSASESGTCIDSPASSISSKSTTGTAPSTSSSSSSSSSSLRRSARIQKLQLSNSTSSSSSFIATSPTSSSYSSTIANTSSSSSSSSSSSFCTVQYTPFHKQMNYIQRHQDLTPKARSILIDWLIDVSVECKFDPVTLSTAVALADRCLAVCTFRKWVKKDWQQRKMERKEQRESEGHEFCYDCHSRFCGCFGHDSEEEEDEEDDEKDEDEGNGEFVIGCNTLQLLGCGCMIIASKLHDVDDVKPEKFTYLSADSYTETEIVKMEQKICSALRFHLQVVTPQHFIHRFLRASHVSNNQYHSPVFQQFTNGGFGSGMLSAGTSSIAATNTTTTTGRMGGPPPPCSLQWKDCQLRFMVDFLLEIAMVEIDFVAMKPSVIAAGAIYLARAILNIRDVHERSLPVTSDNDQLSSHDNEDTDNQEMKQRRHEEEHESKYGYFYSRALEYYTGYKVDDIVDVVKILNRAHRQTIIQSTKTDPSLNAVYEKYSHSKYKSVAFKATIDPKALFPDVIDDGESENEESDSAENEGSDDDENEGSDDELYYGF